MRLREKHSAFWQRFAKEDYPPITNTMQLMLHRINAHEDEQLEALKKENAELHDSNKEQARLKESVRGIMVRGCKDRWSLFETMTKRQAETLNLDDVMEMERG